MKSIDELYRQDMVNDAIAHCCLYMHDKEMSTFEQWYVASCMLNAATEMIAGQNQQVRDMLHGIEEDMRA